MKKTTLLPLLVLLGTTLAAHGHDSIVPFSPHMQCQTQQLGKTEIEMCLIPKAAYRHDIYTLKAGKALVFALVDDYAERVQLEHEHPDMAGDGALPLNGDSTVAIKGGCMPENRNSPKSTRVCSFLWGKAPTITSVRFEFLPL